MVWVNEVHDDNWKPDQTLTDYVQSLKNGEYRLGIQNGLQYYLPKLHARIASNSPGLSIWGTPLITITDESGKIVAKKETPSASNFFYFPPDNTEYTIKYTWPALENDDVSKEFKYKETDYKNLHSFTFWENSHNTYQSGPDKYDLPIEVTYTKRNGKTATKTIEASYDDNHEYVRKTPNPYIFTIYEPDGIKGLMYITIKETGRLHIGNVKNGAISHPVTTLSRPVIGSHEIYKAESTWSYVPELVEDAGFQMIKLVNSKGSSIAKNVKIKYLYADPATMQIDNELPMGTVSAMNKATNSFLIEAPRKTNRKLLFEITAEGYQPQMIEYKLMNGRARVVKMKLPTEHNYFDISLTEDGSTQDLSYLPTNGTYMYTPSKNSQLSLTIPIKAEHKGYSLQNFILSGKNVLTNLTPSASRIVSYSFFENSYALLSYNLTSFIAKEKSSQTYIKSVPHKTNLTLPTLKNQELDIDKQKREVSNTFAKTGIPEPEVSSAPDKVDLRQTAGAFEQFNFSMPSTLPITIEIEKDGDEWILRGVFSKNVLPGGEVMDAVGLAQDFESLFNECRDQVNKIGKRNLNSRYDEHDNYFGKSPFVGVKVFVSGKIAQNPETSVYEFSFNDGGLALEVSGEVVYKADCFISSFSVGVGGTLRSTMKLADPSKEDKARNPDGVKLDIIFDTEASLNVWASLKAGFDVYLIGAEVGLRGIAWADYHSRIMVKPYLPKASMLQSGHKIDLGANLQLYSWFKLFGYKIWTKEYNILNIDKTIYWPDDASNVLKPEITPRRITRSGLLSDTYSKPLFSNTNLALRDLDISAEPLYFNDGSFALNNLKDVDDQDDNRIQVYGSDGKSVDINTDANTSAYTFHASSAGSHKIVAYEELSEAFGTPDLTDAPQFISSQALKSEMAVSVFNNGSKQWDYKRLTNDAIADIRPQTAIASTGNAVALWSKGVIEFKTNNADNEAEGSSLSNIEVDEENPKIRVVPESVDLRNYTKGDLMIAHYRNGVWGNPISVFKLDSIAELRDYTVALSGKNNALIAAVRKPSAISKSKEGDIILISAKQSGAIDVIETGEKGASPKFTKVGDNFLLSFLTERVSNNDELGQETTKQDIYLTMLDDEGNANSTGLHIDGYANIDKPMMKYKIVAKENAKSLEDLVLAWKGSLMEYTDDATTIKTELYASKFGKSEAGDVYLSEPKSIFTEPHGLEISSFDIHIADNDKMKAAILIADESASGAGITEETFSFDNKIAYVNEYYALRKVEAKEQLPIEFTVKNKGYLPIESFNVTMGNNSQETFVNTLPGREMTISGLCVVPENESEPELPYTITAKFSDNSTSKIEGSVKLAAVNMNVKLISTDTDEETTTIMIDVANVSSLPISKEYEFSLGLYEDVLGQKIFPGTTPKAIPFEELFANETNQSTVVSFQIENVKDVKPAYALINIKKKAKTRSVASSSIENQNPDGNNAMIMLFPYHRTYWTGTIDSNWDNIENWTSGLPDETYDAVIQRGTPHYPILKGGEVCRNIYFKAGSNITRQDYLKYEKAFVQYDYQSSDSRGRWHLLTVPLQEAYPGDFHYGGYPEANLSEFGVNLNSNGSAAPNFEKEPKLDSPLVAGIGYAYKLGDDDGKDNRGLQLSQGKLVIPFFLEESEVEPDVHYQHSFTSQPNGDILGTSIFYNYKTTGGTPAYELIQDDYYSVSRTKSAYKLVDKVVSVPLRFTEDSPLSSIGNPFMGAISFKALHGANSSKIKNSYQIISGKGELETVKGYNVIAGHFGSVDGNDLTDAIPPIQGVVVEKTKDATSNSDLSFNVIQTTDNQIGGQAEVNENKLSILASNGEAQSLTVIAKDPNGSLSFGDSDSRKLMMNTNSVPEVYTLKPIGENMIAVGANVINSDDVQIPLGIRTTSTNAMSLTFTGMDSYDAKIYFGDRAENKTVDLTKMETYTHSLGDGAKVSLDDRFYILIKPLTYTGLIESDGSELKVYSSRKIIYAISGASNPIQEISVYNVQGVLLYTESVNTSLYQSSSEFGNGAYLLKLKTEKGIFSRKVVVVDSY